MLAIALECRLSKEDILRFTAMKFIWDSVVLLLCAV
jgi:hypothetical protein